MNQSASTRTHSPRVEEPAAAAAAQKGKSKVRITASDGSRREAVTIKQEKPAVVSNGPAEPEEPPVEVEDDGEGDEEEEEDDDDDDDEVDNFTTSEIVTVHVGPKRKRFHLHRDLICERSPFMEKCLQKNRFDEGYKNEMYLPEDDPKAFSIVVEWIYRGRLPSFGTGAGSGGSAVPARGLCGLDMCDISAAYCMADKFGMEELQNGIMDCIRTHYRLSASSGTTTSASTSASASGNGHNHSHFHHIINCGHSSRDSTRTSLGLSGTAADRDRDAHAGSDSTSHLVPRPSYAALALVHLHGPHKSPLKRFFIEHLVHHMMTFPRHYHDHLRKNVGEDSRAEFEELFKIPELSLLIMRKVWQWQIEKFGDPARDKGCAYHVHSTTQCESKPRSTSATAGKSTTGSRPLGQGMGGSPSTHPAVILQNLARNQQAQAGWMGGSSSSLGGWHPGSGW
ncbi:hypothetical protein Z517_11428 [Fonsecaea pedrosoi CBS 271.37]|uniref:BTB domain-containing protein n=1 Tax=Fonsecaea pedrosoi CBS 271.37 TaxID=1442368 RepID=A0A0D2G1I4_9EURO|nr:uncharacterized protein Z517_11428 [Fonsecaea pedrosoi CBS 271.37]KIW74658.1 hypothetical protein Z517_11428 [Fonsecaea pedrosoi CBS 271.37]